MKTNTELIILGTGNAMVTRCYNTCFAIRKNEACLLVDAGGGNGIFRQLEDAGISVSQIHHLILTHAHSDHILGVVWLVRKVAAAMLAGKYEGDFRIYCHKEAGEALYTICSVTLAGKFMKCIGERIFIHTVTDAQNLEIMDMPVTFFDIGSTKMKQFGFRLMAEGKAVTCLGDEPFYECERIYAEGCDYLLCEAFCTYRDREIFKPYEKHHSTALDAGKLAQELSVKNLILYHTEDKTLEMRKELYTEEAAQFFKGNIFVPDDLERISIT